MSDAKHTPGGLTVRGRELISERGKIVGAAYGFVQDGQEAPADANAARLALCWNMHEELLELAEQGVQALEAQQRMMHNSDLDERVVKARRALSAARGNGRGE